MEPLSAAQVTQFKEEGYVVVDGLVTELEELRAAARRITQRARKGEWKHGIRTAEAPWPPYVQDASKDVWGIHSVVHPDEKEPAMLRWYGSAEVATAVSALLGVRPDELQLELVNMLVNPTMANFALSWHRDMIANSVSEEEEAKALQEGAGEQSGVQWNTALFDDECFVFVSGSHTRVRNAVEREVTLSTPYEHLPKEVTLKLKAGQTAFYNPNLLHRGLYNTEVERATLHCSMGAPCLGGATRAANVVHVLGRDKIAWLTDPVFVETLEGGVKTIHTNLINSMAEAKAKGLIANSDEEDVRIQSYKKDLERRER